MEIVKFTVTAYVQAGCDLVQEIEDLLIEDDRISWREVTEISIESTDKTFPEDDGNLKELQTRNICQISV